MKKYIVLIESECTADLYDACDKTHDVYEFSTLKEAKDFAKKNNGKVFVSTEKKVSR